MIAIVITICIIVKPRCCLARLLPFISASTSDRQSFAGRHNSAWSMFEQQSFRRGWRRKLDVFAGLLRKHQVAPLL